MARHEPDKSSKWLIQNYGNSILRLGGASRIQRWKALKAELVQPRQLPDGLLEVYFHNQKKPDYFLLEIASYPEKRIVGQVLDDMMLAFQQLRELPELLTVILAQRGRFQVTGRQELHSRLGWSELGFHWKVIELWKLPAEGLLAAGDVGLIPWVPLSHFTGPPDQLFQQCRAKIEAGASYREQVNLLAVSQVLANLRYDDPDLLSILGGSRVMLESPVLQKLIAETKHEYILKALKARFGDVPQEVASRVRRVRKEQRLDELHDFAITCSDLAAFASRLNS